MDYEVVALPERTITGIAVRTSNSDPEMEQKMSGLWTRYFAEEEPDAEARKVSKTFGLYTHYENGAQGAYDALVGREADPGRALSEGEQCVTIPAGQYAKFCFRGDVEKDVGRFWAEIWKTPLPRRFTCDFEEYPSCGDCSNMEVAIYVALADFCQSCGMPMTEDSQRGTNADGSKSADYCCYCYQNGAFTADCTMEQMIDFCLDMEKDSGRYQDRGQAKKEMLSWFPELKRWAGAAGK